MTRRARIVILGAGTAGLTALKEARRHTDDVLLINDGPYGTTCARVGCMPSKALLEVAHAYARRDWLAGAGITGTADLAVDLAAVMAHVRGLRDRFVAGPIELAESLGERSIRGRPRFLDPQTLEVNGERIHADAVVIATGTHPIVPDDWRALGERVVTSDGVFELVSPGRRIGVVGLGPVGVELSQAFAQLGCDVHAFTQKTTVAALTDPAVNTSLLEVLRRQMSVSTDTTVEARPERAGVVLDDGTNPVVVDWVLASLGRRPNIEGLGLDTLGAPLDKRGVPAFDPATLRIGNLPIYIAGDVNKLHPLLHEAVDDGRIAAYHALQPDAACLARRTPLSMVFTEPGAGRVGLSFSELPDSGIVTGAADFSRQGRAVTAGRNAGLMHLYASTADGRVVGAEVVAPDAEHLLHLLAWAVQQCLTVNQILQMPFYHPTLEEGLRSALQSARRALSERSPQPDLPLCREAVDWALG
ncbi:MAG: dihydrolipoyl dehydrogenase [Rhodanobacter sp.]